MRRVLPALGTAALMATAAPAPAYGTGEIACAPAGAAITAVPWAQRELGPQRVWPLATGKGVTVAVVDSGVDGGAPQLRGAVAAGRDYLGTERRADSDCVGHGTAVASIIAARPDPRVAFAGLAPDARILPLRVSTLPEGEQDDPGHPRTTRYGLVAAIRYATAQHVGVINLSLTVPADYPPLRAAVRDAVAAGVIVVAAVGGAAGTTPYPAAYPGVIGVGAVDRTGRRYASSPVSPYVDVVAPGVDVTVDAPHGGQTTVSGTSFATAFVAGTAALVLDYHSGEHLSGAQVRQRILATADPTPGGPRSDVYGWGIVDPYRAVTEPLAVAGTPTAEPPVPKRMPRAPSTRPVDAPDSDRATALGFAGAGGATAGLLVVLARVVRRGRRRGWRPGGGP